MTIKINHYRYMQYFVSSITIALAECGIEAVLP